MNRRLNGQTVGAVGLGCMNLSHAYGPAMPADAAETFLNEALDEGYDFLDTATLYGDGENEKLIGRALSRRRSEFFLASKCVLGFVDGKRALDGRPEVIKRQCDESLTRLQTDKIDLYYMHRLDRNVPVEDSIGALADLVQAGKIGGIGVSEMGAQTIRRAHATHPLTAVQSEYSLWSRNAEIAVLDTCAELGIAYVAFSPVARGYLADRSIVPAELHESDLRRGMPRFSSDDYPKNLALLSRPREIAAALGCTLAQLGLSWLLAQGEHVFAIPGTTNRAHMQDNLKAGAVEIPAEMLDEISAIFEPRAISGNRYSEAAQKTVDTECFEFEG